MNWQGIEDVRGLVAVPAIWRARLGADFETFSRAFLRARPETARSIPCPHGCGCAHEVVKHDNGRLVGVCQCEPWNCDDLTLTTADIALLELNTVKLGRAVAKAFGLDVRETKLGIPGALQIGAFGHAALPVALVLRGERDEFRAVLAELVARWRERFIVLTPTSRLWDGRSKELVESARVGLFDLQTRVTLNPQGQFYAVKSAAELFGLFLPPVAGETPEDVVRAAFQLLERLDSEEGLKPPTLITVFRFYCGHGLTAKAVADRCGCSKGTVINRLKLLVRKAGMNPKKMRAYSSQFEQVEDEMNDSRAKKVSAKGMLDEADGEVDEKD